MILAGFAVFVVTYLRKEGHKDNSAANAERAVGAVRNYYLHMLDRTPGSGRGVDFTKTLRGFTGGLRKFYPADPMSRVLLLANDMR